MAMPSQRSKNFGDVDVALLRRLSKLQIAQLQNANCLSFGGEQR